MRGRVAVGDDGAVDDSVRELWDAACEVRERSHSPYSRYRVGAALRTADGQVFVGCNVENAAYPEGVCAEGGAISAMVAGTDGEPNIVEIVTVTSGDTPGTPCGGCRQKIREFATPATRIHATTVDGAVESVVMDELLPSSFGPERLA